MRKQLLAAILIAPLAACGGGTAGGLDELLKEAQGSDFLKSVVDNAGKADDAVVGNAAKLIGDKYCPTVPGVGRSFARNHINARPEMKGAKIGVWCPGDPPLVLGP